MIKLYRISLFVLMALSCAAAQAEKPATPIQKPASAAPVAVNDVLSTALTRLQRLMGPLAQAMPEEKYQFAPSNGEFKGVRTFGEQLKHVAASNYTFAASILGEKPPADAEDENGPESVKTKKEIIKYLDDSFAYVQKAVTSIDEKNLTIRIKSPFGTGETTRLAMTALIIGHCFDHYGQMVEYLRMNGIVPPASQR